MKLNTDSRKQQLGWTRLLLRPIVRFCLRRSQTYQDLSTVLKELFVEIAAEEIEKLSDKINVSRISVLTGLNRREVTRIYKDQEPSRNETISIPLRVIGQWQSDKRFQSKSGRPRSLSFDGEASEFRALVTTVSTYVHPSTVQFELERMGVVERTKSGLKLTSPMSRIGANPDQTFELLSQDSEALIRCVEENTLERQPLTNHHIRTEYDNVYVAELPAIRKWLQVEGEKFQKRVREFLAKRDRDVTPKREESLAGAKVVVTSFSVTSPYWK